MQTGLSDLELHYAGSEKAIKRVLHDIFNPHPPVPSEHEHLLALPIAGSLKGGADQRKRPPIPSECYC